VDRGQATQYSIPNTQYAIRIQHRAWRRAHGGNGDVIARRPKADAAISIRTTQYEFSKARGKARGTRQEARSDGCWVMGDVIPEFPSVNKICHPGTPDLIRGIRDHMGIKIFLRGPGYLSLSLKIPG